MAEGGMKHTGIELKLDEMLATPMVHPFVTPTEHPLRDDDPSRCTNVVKPAKRQPSAPASSGSTQECTLLPQAPVPKGDGSGCGVTHTLKHKRHKVPLAPIDSQMSASSLPDGTQLPHADIAGPKCSSRQRGQTAMAESDLAVAASATRLLEQIQSMPFSSDVMCEIAADPHDLSQHIQIVQSIKNHIDLLKESLPTYADVLEDVSVVMSTTLKRNISRSQTTLVKLKKKLLRDSMERETREIKNKIQCLEETATSNAQKFAEYEKWRRQRLVDQQQHIATVKQEIDHAKSVMEARLLEIAQANERIAALYQRHLEARRFMNSVEDIQEKEAEVLINIEKMSDHKNSLSEKFLELRENSRADLEAMRLEKIELENTIFQLRTRLSTVERKVKAVRTDLTGKELELKRQVEANAGLRESQERWREKLAAREAFEWRAQTPRPDHNSDHGLLALVDFPRTSATPSSTMIVDAGLKKLSSLTTATKKQFEELLRLSRVIRPLSNIVFYVQIDPSQGFRDNESDTIIVTPSSDLLTFISHAEHPLNEKWSQATTERHALAMFKVLPIVPLTSNSPQNRVNEAVMKWCMGPDFNAQSFPANLLLSLRVYSRISPICRAALLTLYAKLPLNFGDSVLQLFTEATHSTDALVPLRNMQTQLAKHLGKENSCLGTFFALQAKLAASLDAAVVGGNVRIANLTDLVDHKRNSGLLLRTIFAHFLFQDQTIRQAIANTAMECARSSLTTSRDVLIHEPTLRARLEMLRWDPEQFQGNGVRYGASRHIVALSVKVVADQMFSGLSRVDGAMHRLDESVRSSSSGTGGASATGSSKQPTTAGKGSGGSKAAGSDGSQQSNPPVSGSTGPSAGSGRKEYVHAEPLLAAINIVSIRLAEVKNAD